jgi:hypothetical protein
LVAGFEPVMTAEMFPAVVAVDVVVADVVDVVGDDGAVLVLLVVDRSSLLIFLFA